MKLTLSNNNLSNENTVKNLLFLLQSKKHLQYLDLSNSSFSPEDLKLISNELINNSIIRDLNLSYNTLQY